MHELCPSIDGSPLEICLALLLGDYAPGEAAALITRVLDPADDTARLIANARTNFFQASNLNRMEELEQSLAFIRSAKAKLREAALIWLGPRECACCRRMRARLEREMGREAA